MDQTTERGREQLRGIARNAMIDHGLLPEFSAAVTAELRGIAKPAGIAASMRDLRDLPWVSIDNDDSRDLDQLSVVTSEAGSVKVLVAIADVDAIVHQGSAIDGHARTNTTSVYTAAEIFSMLPEMLSTDLTSLGEDQDRVAIVIEMAVSDRDGSVGASDIYRAAVRNHAKLAYNSVAAWLEGTTAPPGRLAQDAELQKQLRIQDRIAQAMKQLRHSHGALSLQTVQARPVFQNDVLIDLQAEEKNRAA
ncbi:MAG TPA: RNB domain-containing ribonuclease, partial [Candidatus Binataceae bacterium]|nr:RNB domain-containing ribonuclease [Candidatus Binataceae bacterium]